MPYVLYDLAHPLAPNQLAQLITDIVTDEVREQLADAGKNKPLGRQGGLNGGAPPVKTLTDLQRKETARREPEAVRPARR